MDSGGGRSTSPRRRIFEKARTRLAVRGDGAARESGPPPDGTTATLAALRIRKTRETSSVERGNAIAAVPG